MIECPMHYQTFCGEKIKEKIDEVVKNHDDYLFRGQSQAKWHAQPSAFRNNVVKDIYDQLPIDKNSFIACLWENRGLWISNFSSDSNHRISSSHDFFGSVYMSLHKQCYPVENHVTWAMWSLGYLKYLTKHYSIDTHTQLLTIFPENRDLPRIETLLLKKEYTEDNIKKIMLNSFEMNIMCSMEYNSLHDGKKLDFGGKVDEPSAPLPESYLQHYICSTCVIDFTSDPLIALYFALTENNNWIEIKHDTPCKTALYQIKICPDCDNFELIDDSNALLINNKRKEAQKGTFLRIKNAHWFYLLSGKFPSLEDLKRKNQCSCYMKKNVFEVFPKDLDFLKTRLKEKSICTETLFPDQKNSSS